jgi:predicted aldo/keto reductase-like oxidoreductase
MMVLTPEQLAELLETVNGAIFDLDTWHTEALAYTTSSGGIWSGQSGTCAGCHTCEETLPSLRAVSEMLSTAQRKLAERKEV